MRQNRSGLNDRCVVFRSYSWHLVPGRPDVLAVSAIKKACTRQLFAEGKVGRDACLKAKWALPQPGYLYLLRYRQPNQMMMEMMAYTPPAAAFVHPYTDLREALTRYAAGPLARGIKTHHQPLGEMLTEKSFINAPIGLMATGGSDQPHHAPRCYGACCRRTLNWDDFDEISSIIPLLIPCVPQRQSRTQTTFTALPAACLVIRELLDAGLLHR